MENAFLAVGVFGIGKPQNAAQLVRTARAWGVDRFFVVAPQGELMDVVAGAPGLDGRVVSDLSGADLPAGCKLVGVEMVEDAVSLADFVHPAQVAYLFGPEGGALPAGVLAACDDVVRIPAPSTDCLNLVQSAAVVLYDRFLKGDQAR